MPASRWLVGRAARPKLKPPEATWTDGRCLWLHGRPDRRDDVRQSAADKRRGHAPQAVLTWQHLPSTRAAWPLACFVRSAAGPCCGLRPRGAVGGALRASAASGGVAVGALPRMASVVSGLGSKLLDQNLGLPQRFRVLFSLRGVGTPEAADALLAGTCSVACVPPHRAPFSDVSPSARSYRRPICSVPPRGGFRARTNAGTRPCCSVAVRKLTEVGNGRRQEPSPRSPQNSVTSQSTPWCATRQPKRWAQLRRPSACCSWSGLRWTSAARWRRPANSPWAAFDIGESTGRATHKRQPQKALARRRLPSHSRAPRRQQLLQMPRQMGSRRSCLVRVLQERPG